jgi:hypothetical protein
LQSVLDELRNQSLSPRHLRDWIAIDFKDGSDTFFARITPNSASATPAAIASAIEKEFHHIDKIRSAVLTGLRWFLVEHNIAVEISVCDHWPTQQGNASSSLNVGPRLTRIAQQSATAAEALLKFRENQWLPEISADKAATLVQKTEPPPREIRWKSDDEIIPLFNPNIASIDCKNIENVDLAKGASSTEFLDWLAPTRNSPAQHVINKFGEAVGLHRFSLEITTGIAGFEFTDKLDSFPLHPRSKRLARLIEKSGEDQALAELINQFKSLDEARTRALALIEHIMAAHNFDLDEDDQHFGKTHRQFQFPTGRALTAKLHKFSPDQVVFEWISRNTPFHPLPTLNDIEALPANEHLTRANRRHLPFRDPKTLPHFPTLADYPRADLDKTATEIIDRVKTKFLRVKPNTRVIEYEDNLQFWSRPLYYTRPRDAWVDESFWIQLATKYWNDQRHPLAGIILVLNGDPSPLPQLLEPIKTADEYNSEFTWDEVWWLGIDQVSCPIDEYDTYPSFSKSMGPLPPQLGRFSASRIRAQLLKQSVSSAITYAVDLDRTSLLEWLSPPELDTLREACREWSRSRDHLELINHDWINLAATMGWNEIPENLAQNPEFIPAQLNWQLQMGDLYFVAGELALILSQFKNSDLALRFAAQTLTRKTAKDLTLDKFQAAIAWLRCSAAARE